MKKVKAIIIDDEPLAHRIIERFCDDLPFIELVGNCYLATEAYGLLHDQKVDLIFLDINMPKLKGIDFLKTLERKPNVIITSAYEEYALQGFEQQVSDYLLKPFSFDRFLKAINKVQKQIALVEQNSTVSDSPAADTQQKLFIKVDRKHIHIDLDEIYCLESYGNYVKVWLKDDMLLTPRTLKSFESELDQEKFPRIHKSFLIQKSFVKFIEGHQLTLKNQMTVPIGKNHRRGVKDWFS